MADDTTRRQAGRPSTRCGRATAAACAVRIALAAGVLGSTPAGAQSTPTPPAGARFAAEIARVTADAAADRRRPVVFVGSSSIRRWRRLAADLAPWPVRNHGFGGATCPDVAAHAGPLLRAARPRAIVLYCGENDLAAGARPADAVAALRAVLAHAPPETPILLIGAKPSPIRAAHRPRQIAFNARLRRLAAEQARWRYVDIAGPLRAAPDFAGLFVADRLHLSDRGYRLWAQSIRAALRPLLPGADAAP